jgi:hypothetical protein
MAHIALIQVLTTQRVEDGLIGVVLLSHVSRGNRQ